MSRQLVEIVGTFEYAGFLSSPLFKNLSISHVLVCKFVALEEIDPLSTRAAGQTAPHRAHRSV